MKKIIFILIFIFLIKVIPSFALEINEFPVIPNVSSTGYANYLDDTPPEIKKVLIIPEIPTPKDTVIVRAWISPNKKKTDSTVLEANLFYSIDEENFEKTEMQQDENDEEVWIAKIPPQKEDTTVYFYISAVDTVGNRVTEIAYKSKSSSFPPDDKNLVLLNEDEDETDESVPKSLDIVSSFIGYDKNYFYFKITTEGKIKDGTLDPPFLHSYGILAFNLNKGADILKSYVVDYTPHLKLANYPEAIFYNLGKILIDYDFFPEWEVQNNVLYFKVKRTAFGEESEKGYKFVIYTLGITDTRLRDDTVQAGGIPAGVINLFEYTLSEFRGLSVINLSDLDLIREVLFLEDISFYTIVYFRSHNYTVKKLSS
jgi:hypothetical protein